MLQEFKEPKNIKMFLNLSASSVLTFIFQQGLPQLLTTLFISWKNDPVALSVFGVSNTVLTLLFIQLIKGIGESTALQTKKYFEQNRNAMVNSYFIKGLLVFLIIFIVFVFLVIFSESWLMWLKIEPEIIPRTKLFLLQSIPFLFFMGLNLFFQEFSTSLGFYLIFKKMNFINLFLTIFLSYLFITVLDFKEFGFVYTKTV